MFAVFMLQIKTFNKQKLHIYHSEIWILYTKQYICVINILNWKPHKCVCVWTNCLSKKHTKSDFDVIFVGVRMSVLCLTLYLLLTPTPLILNYKSLFLMDACFTLYVANINFLNYVLCLELISIHEMGFPSRTHWGNIFTVTKISAIETDNQQKYKRCQNVFMLNITRFCVFREIKSL